MTIRTACSGVLHDPVATLRSEELHRSASVTVFDVRCRPCEFARGPEEWSRTNQIVFPRRGVFEREARGDKIVADANHVLFFNRDEPYHVAHPTGSGDDCTVFVFEEALLREAVGAIAGAPEESATPPFEFMHVLSDEATFLLHDQLWRQARERTNEALAIDESSVQLLTALLERAHRTRSRGRRQGRSATQELHREQTRRTALFLAEHLGDDLSLEDVARAVHCSPFHLARVFRRELGTTIHQYRHRLRLREALRRVADGESELSALALDLGFASHSHLTDAFRRAFGRPPSALRRALSSRALRELSRNLEAGPR
jgi:AraC family transcriptional regulator